MSWQITINNLKDTRTLTSEQLTKVAEDNPMYAIDAAVAFIAAKKAGLASCTLAGGRTPSPDNQDEVVNIAITGLGTSVEFYGAMQGIVTQGAQ